MAKRIGIRHNFLALPTSLMIPRESGWDIYDPDVLITVLLLNVPVSPLLAYILRTMYYQWPCHQSRSEKRLVKSTGKIPFDREDLDGVIKERPGLDSSPPYSSNQKTIKKNPSSFHHDLVKRTTASLYRLEKVFIRIHKFTIVTIDTFLS